MQCIPHVFPFIQFHWAMVSCHWLLNVTLQFTRAAAVLELIGQFFCSYTCWNFMSCLHWHTGLVCRAVCAKLNMMFKWIVDKTEVILLVLLTYFRFCNGRNLQMLLIVNTVLGSCEYGKRVESTFFSPVYRLYLYASLGTFNQNSPLP